LTSCRIRKGHNGGKGNSRQPTFILSPAPVFANDAWG
jgi:hypothetical protein